MLSSISYYWYQLSIFILAVILTISHSQSPPNQIVGGNSGGSTTIQRSIRSKEVIIITGNFSLDGKLTNIAEFDIQESKWSPDYSTDLYLYGESNGVVWDIAVNRSTHTAYNTMFVVGAFDTVSETSQIQYCSVGQWDGIFFDKVGEGLCPRGSDASTTVQLQTVTLGDNGDIFVGGTFESRVWDGHHFVRIMHVAKFDSQKVSWLPLRGGELKCMNGDSPRVNTLAWDSANGVLFIGGSFDSLDDYPISSGLAVWSSQTGLESFPGGEGLTQKSLGKQGIVSDIAFEPVSQSLFVAGAFLEINNKTCSSIAVWHRRSNEWICLFQALRGITPITTIFLDDTTLFASGWALPTSDWYSSNSGSGTAGGVKPQFPYTIAHLNIEGYIEERMNKKWDDDSNNSNNNSGIKDSGNNSSSTNSTNTDSNNSGGGGSSTNSTNKSHLVNRMLYQKNGYNLNNHNHIHNSNSNHYTNPQLQHDSSRDRYNLYTTSSASNRKQNRRRNSGVQRKLRHRSYDDNDYINAHHRLGSVSNSNREYKRFNNNNNNNNNSNRQLQSKSKYNQHKQYNQQPYQHHSFSQLLQSSSSSFSIVPTASPIYTVTATTTNNNSTTLPPIITVTNTTRPQQWKPEWKWLPGFLGGNGPILEITRGQNTYGNSLFIVGAFNNFPSVILWTNTLAEGPKVSTLISKQSIQGLVTSVAQVYVKFMDVLKPTPSPELQKDYTFLILISCVLVGVFLGISVALGFRFSGYSKLSTQDIENNNQNNDDLELNSIGGGGVGGNGNVGMNGAGIPLKTLSGDYLSVSVDFKECFERAMKARHLPTHESLLVINPKEIVLSRIIGEGSFGRVWSAQWRNSSVAVKEFVFAQAAIVGGSVERNKLIEEIVGEAGVMACLRHPKILTLYGCSLTLQAIWIVSELCIRGSLRAILNDEKLDLPLVKRLSICIDIADGMMYLHTRNPPIIHRDLKSQNIFITEPQPNRFIAKIGDWGSARAIALGGAKSMTHGVGTACWLAPEVINYAHYSKDSDVYAFGIVLWEIFTRQDVYEGYSAAQIISKVAHEGLRPRVPPGESTGSLMSECWSQNPSERPGFHRILKKLSKLYTTTKTQLKMDISSDHLAMGSSSSSATVGGSSSVDGDDNNDSPPSSSSAAVGVGGENTTTRGAGAAAGINNRNDNNNNQNPNYFTATSSGGAAGASGGRGGGAGLTLDYKERVMDNSLTSSSINASFRLQALQGLQQSSQQQPFPKLKQYHSLDSSMYFSKELLFSSKDGGGSSSDRSVIIANQPSTAFDSQSNMMVENNPHSTDVRKVSLSFGRELERLARSPQEYNNNNNNKGGGGGGMSMAAVMNAASRSGSDKDGGGGSSGSVTSSVSGSVGGAGSSSDGRDGGGGSVVSGDSASHNKPQSQQQGGRVVTAGPGPDPEENYLKPRRSHLVRRMSEPGLYRHSRSSLMSSSSNNNNNNATAAAVKNSGIAGGVDVSSARGIHRIPSVHIMTEHQLLLQKQNSLQNQSNQSSSSSSSSLSSKHNSPSARQSFNRQQELSTANNNNSNANNNNNNQSEQQLLASSSSSQSLSHMDINDVFNQHHPDDNNNNNDDDEHTAFSSAGGDALNILNQSSSSSSSRSGGTGGGVMNNSSSSSMHSAIPLDHHRRAAMLPQRQHDEPLSPYSDHNRQQRNNRNSNNNNNNNVRNSNSRLSNNTNINSSSSGNNNNNNSNNSSSSSFNYQDIADSNDDGDDEDDSYEIALKGQTLSSKSLSVTTAATALAATDTTASKTATVPTNNTNNNNSSNMIPILSNTNTAQAYSLASVSPSDVTPKLFNYDGYTPSLRTAATAAGTTTVSASNVAATTTANTNESSSGSAGIGGVNNVTFVSNQINNDDEERIRLVRLSGSSFSSITTALAGSSSSSSSDRNQTSSSAITATTTTTLITDSVWIETSDSDSKNKNNNVVTNNNMAPAITNITNTSSSNSSSSDDVSGNGGGSVSSDSSATLTSAVTTSVTPLTLNLPLSVKVITRISSTGTISPVSDKDKSI